MLEIKIQIKVDIPAIKTEIVRFLSGIIYSNKKIDIPTNTPVNIDVSIFHFLIKTTPFNALF